MKFTFFSKDLRKRHGFTLVETVIALGILVVLITGFLAVFGPAARTIKKTLSTDEASRLQASLELELRSLRPGVEQQRFQGDPFLKAIEWISQSEERGQTIIIYKYRALPGQTRPDGSLQPASRELGIAGRDFIVQPMVRRISDRLLEEDLNAVEGRVFFVKLRQLVYRDDGLQVSDRVGQIVDPNGGSRDFSTNPQAFPDAAIAYRAEYFSVPTKQFGYLRNAFDPALFTNPIFSRNLAVRR